MPYPSTLEAVRESRHLMLLEEAARERRAASAVLQPITQEGAMISAGLRASIVQRGHVAGVQFHPEKSGEVGLLILRNFLRWAAR